MPAIIVPEKDRGKKKILEEKTATIFQFFLEMINWNIQEAKATPS